MSTMRFLLQYIRKPRSTGAVLPSSLHLARAMVANTNFAAQSCIVEFGAGTGVFTREILRHRNPSTPILIFERNHDFYNMLLREFSGTPNLHIIHDSASELGRHLDELGLPAPGVIFSGLPFASLPDSVSHDILAAASLNLPENGAFITFQYTRMKLSLFSQYFPLITLSRRIWLNVPPAYVLTCINRAHSERNV